MIGASRTGWVAGVDGCRGGWVVVLRDRQTAALRARVVSDFASVLALPEAPGVIAVDVPIGLAGAATAGGRGCDVLARQLLGPRASSVFSAPTRAALAAFRSGGGYFAVCTANRGGDPRAPAISRQVFNILAKIDDVDRTLGAASQDSVVEIHPEVCFAEANGGRAMAHSKKTSAGRSERLKVLAKLGFTSPSLLLGAKLPAGAKVDDVLDASIACWTAGRIAAGCALRVPAVPPIDARGLRMEVWR